MQPCAPRISVEIVVFLLADNGIMNGYGRAMKSDDQQASLTRRSFLRGASLLGLGGAVDAVATPFERGAGLRPAPAPQAQPAQNFDRFR